MNILEIYYNYDTNHIVEIHLHRLKYLYFANQNQQLEKMN